MKESYDPFEIGELLGINADKVIKYREKGIIPYSVDAAGFKNYSPLAITLILREECKKKSSNVEKRGSEYVLKTGSLEELVKKAKLAEAKNLVGEVEKPVYDKGGYTAVARYYFKPARGAAIIYEESYSLDRADEIDDVKEQVCEELRQLAAKEKIMTQIVIKR